MILKEYNLKFHLPNRRNIVNENLKLNKPKHVWKILKIDSIELKVEAERYFISNWEYYDKMSYLRLYFLTCGM